MYILITTGEETLTREALEAARILTEAGFSCLVDAPGCRRPEDWLPGGETPSRERLLREAARYAHARHPEEGLMLLSPEAGWTAEDALRLAAVMEESPGKVALACRAGHPPAGERLAAGLYGMAQGQAAGDLYSGLQGWPAALVEEAARRGGPAWTPPLTWVRELGLSIRQASMQKAPAAARRAPGLLLRDMLCYLGVFLRFTGSSVASAGLDYGLFALLLPFIGPAELTNVAARIVSSVFNFTVNRTLVFTTRRKTPLLRALAGYYLLAAVILGASTGLIHVFSTLLGFPPLPVKLLVDLGLYVINFYIQREIIFRRRRESAAA